MGWLGLGEGEGEERRMLRVDFLGRWRAVARARFETRLEIVVALCEQNVFAVEHSVLDL